ncbi:MAG: kynureninase [Chryseolinea sp.]
MTFENSITHARQLDKEDPLRRFRQEFLIPRFNGKPALYFTGNSLGLQPRRTKSIVLEELEDWGTMGVDGHFQARRPWLHYHKFTKRALARIVGAKAAEVVAMNQLTINLHLMMATFYKPTRQRFKIMAEAGAFSSDQYALETQLRWHGLDPNEALIEISPRNGEATLRTEDILQAIQQHGESLALVLFGAVQYYTGQFFDVRTITAEAHRAGAIAGFDLAHAVGNTPLNLHRDKVDFAVWCSYKYLNSGPGAIAGAFVHERHGNNTTTPRLAGWWGHDAKERFEMRKGFKPMPGADGWQVSNVPVLQAAAHLAALDIFEQCGMQSLRRKSVLLTGFLEYLLNSLDPSNQYFKIITPPASRERGCQLSIFFYEHGKKVMKALTAKGMIVDWREPNVIRVAPVPLYNTFVEVYNFVQVLKEELLKVSKKVKLS